MLSPGWLGLRELRTTKGGRNIDNWQPSGQWIKQFREALDDAFDEPSRELLTSDYFGPSSTFSKISPPGFGKTHQTRLQELIQKARMNDWLLDLVVAARERRPQKRAIARIAEDLGLAIGTARIDNPTGQPFEQVIQANAKSIDPAAFYERLHLLESQVCWISIAGGGGTGFLVGPDLVLTNQHVIDRLAKGLARWQDVRCRFDYCEPASGSPLTYIRPTDVGLAHPWLIDSRPPSRYDRHPQLGDAAPEETDSALIRLADPIGDFPVRVDSGDPGAELRKWITASSPPPPLAVGNQVFLLQHPEGKPLRLTIGTVTEFNEAGTRVRYDANSLGGASGSPLFDADLQLVALHHAHDLARPPRWNEAIPLGVIQAASRAHDVILH